MKIKKEIALAFAEWLIFSSDTTHHMNSRSDFWFELLDIEDTRTFSTEEMFEYWIKNIYSHETK